MGFGIPDYKNLDLSGEAEIAARNMEDRAREPASQMLFDRLVAPLAAASVLEFGCGTGALAGRLASIGASILATDKSAVMIGAAKTLHPEISFAVWDVTDPNSVLEAGGFDLIVSSVVAPYFSGEETVAVIARLREMLKPGGVLAFIEQDIETLEIASSLPDFTARIVQRTLASTKNPYRCLGLAPLLELEPLPVVSFDWTDRTYCPYIRRLLDRTAKDMIGAGEASEEEAKAWLEEMESRSTNGDFLYSLTYRRIAGRKRPE